MKEIRVLITGVGGASGMGTLLSLINKKDITIYASDSSRFAVPLYWVKNKIILPFANNSNYISILLKLIYENRIDVIIPNSSEELLPISKNRRKIEKHSKILISPTSSIIIGNDKYKTFEYFIKNKIPIVYTELITKKKDLIYFFENMGKEIIIKPRISRGGRGLKLCKSFNDVLDHYKYLKKILPFKDTHFTELNNNDIIIQEFLPGVEYDVCALYDDNSNLKACVPMKVNSWDIIHNIRQIITEKNQYINNLMKKIGKILNLKGPIDIEFKYDNDNKLKILDFNPRTGGDILLATKSNCNIPYFTILLSLGRKITYKTFIENNILLRYSTFYCINKNNLIKEKKW